MENTKKENKEKLIKCACGFEKVITCIKYLFIVFAVLLLILSVTSCLLAVSHGAERFYLKYQQYLENVKFDYDNGALIFLDNKYITLREVYESGNLNKVLYGYSIKCLVNCVEIVLFVILMHFVAKIFKIIQNNESPFNKNLLKPFKIIFIFLTIVMVFKYALIGLLAGGLFACIYFIYAYGVNMQEDEDMTL